MHWKNTYACFSLKHELQLKDSVLQDIRDLIWCSKSNIHTVTCHTRAQNKTNNKASSSSADISLTQLKPENSLTDLKAFETTQKTATSSVEPKGLNKQRIEVTKKKKKIQNKNNYRCTKLHSHIP